MSRLRMAGNADYKGRLNAVGSAILDDLLGTDRYSKYREIDEVFPEHLTRSNADETLLALSPRTKVIINNGVVSGGDAIVDNKGRINLDKMPYNPDELVSTAPDAVNSDSSDIAKAFIYPEQASNDPKLARAKAIGMAMKNNDVDAYQRAGTPIEVDDDAAAYIAGKLIKGAGGRAIRSGSFATVGGLGSDSRSHILIPGTSTRYLDLDNTGRKGYLDQRTVDLTKQWLRQGGASIGNPSPAIIPPGKASHMDHVQALSSSIDSVGPEGWGYSDSPSNFSWLDAEANVHSKLNYDIGSQHNLMVLADKMRKLGRNFPARLSQAQLGDPNRKRLSGPEAMIRLATDEARTTDEAVENLRLALEILNVNKFQDA